MKQAMVWELAEHLLEEWRARNRKCFKVETAKEKVNGAASSASRLVC